MKTIEKWKLPNAITTIPGDQLIVSLHDRPKKCFYIRGYKLKPQVFDTILFVQLSKQDLGQLNLKSAETIILGESA